MWISNATPNILDFLKNKGKVMSGYQEFLEKEWLRNLRDKAVIKINKPALRAFKKQYNQ